MESPVPGSLPLHYQCQALFLVSIQTLFLSPVPMWGSLPFFRQYLRVCHTCFLSRIVPVYLRNCMDEPLISQPSWGYNPVSGLPGGPHLLTVWFRTIGPLQIIWEYLGCVRKVETVLHAAFSTVHCTSVHILYNEHTCAKCTVYTVHTRHL